MTPERRMQAKDIPDGLVLGIIQAFMVDHPEYRERKFRHRDLLWSFFWNIEDSLALVMPGVPSKVLDAKLRALHRRNLITGCTCGCRGDFATTEAGEALIPPGPLPRIVYRYGVRGSGGVA